MLCSRKITLQIGIVTYISALSVGLGTVLLHSSPARAACAALPTAGGTATFTVSVPTTGAYRFWAHLYSPSAGNNGIYLQVDDLYCQVKVGDSNSIPTGQFSWVDYQSGTPTNKINLSLTAGTHTVYMAGLDPGVGVDKIMLVSDLACVPTGDGSNCVSAAPAPTSSATPRGNGTVTTPSPTVVITPSAGKSSTTGDGTVVVSGVISLPQSSTASKRTYFLDDKPIVGNHLDTTLLPDGDHVLKIIETDAKGGTKITSQKLAIKNNKTLGSRVLGWLTKPVNVGFLIAIGLLLIGGAVAWWRAKLFPQLKLGRPQAENASPSPEDTSTDTPAAPVTPPVAPLATPAPQDPAQRQPGVFYPEPESDDSTKQ